MAAGMVSMAYTAEEQAEEQAEYGATPGNPGNAPKYPWGLCIELNDESLKKLGITDLPKPGATMLLQAHVTVTSISENQQIDNDKEGRMSLQITEMALSAPDTTPPEEKLYGSGAS